MIKNIIFDLDGTLLDTLQDLTNSVNYALLECGYNKKTNEQVKCCIGNGVYKLFERALPDGCKNPKYEFAVNIFKTYYSQNMFNNTKPYSGIIDMLNKLKKYEYNLAVVSNKYDKAAKDLCFKYFNNLIPLVIGENENSGIRKKPAPDSILKVMEFYNADTNNTIYVGDSEVDIQTAKNAGVHCISVTWGYKTAEYLLNNGATNIINKPEEIFLALNN